MDVKKELWTYRVSSYPNFMAMTFMRLSDLQIVDFHFMANVKNSVNRDALFAFLNKEVSGLIGYGNYRYDYQVIHSIISSFYVDPIELYMLIDSIRNRTANMVYEKDFIIPQLDLILVNDLAKLNLNIGDISLFMNYRKVLNDPIKKGENVLEDDIENVLSYNRDCVNVIRHLYRYSMSMIDIRKYISKKFDIKAMNKTDSDLGYSMFIKRYLEISNQKYADINGMKSISLEVYIKDLISDRISFNSSTLTTLLSDLKNDENKISYYANANGSASVEKLKKKILIGNCEMSFTLGGMSSINKPSSFFSDEEGKLIDLDFDSFYPNIISELNIYPAHLGPYYTDCVRDIIKEKDEASKSGDKAAYTSVKKALNSIFGYLGYEYKPICSFKSMYEVTINGQLILLMLLEKLNEHGVEIISVCKDGCVIKTKNEKLVDNIISDFSKNIFNINIKKNSYQRIHMLNVNEYISIGEFGDIKTRGSRFDYSPSPSKDMSFKIIPKAIEAYFVRGIDYKKFILGHDSVYDFCSNMKFDNSAMAIFETLSKHGLIIEEKMDPILRYYISRNTGVIKRRGLKVANNDLYGYKDEVLIKNKNCAVVNVINDKDPSKYDIDYSYYIAEVGKIINSIENIQLKLF